MENTSVSEQFTVRPLTSADIQNVRALHAELAPSSPALRPTIFHQLLTHPTHLCLVVTTPTSDKPVACIAATLHVITSDLTTSRSDAPPPPVEVHVLALGVLPAYRRHGLATRLLHTATTTLRSLAATAPQVPSALVTPRTGTRVFADVVRTDGGARAFWKHVGMQEEEGSREPWATVGWRDAVSVAGSVLSAA